LPESENGGAAGRTESPEGRGRDADDDADP
jgi:hypothetical protein